MVGGHITRAVGPTTLVGLARTVMRNASSTAGNVARRVLICGAAASPSLTNPAAEWDGKSGKRAVLNSLDLRRYGIDSSRGRHTTASRL